MFPATQVHSVVVALDYDPTADDIIPLWRAPAASEVVGAYATTVNDVAASTADYFSVALRNGGAIGTATTAMAAAVGGTAGWTGLTPKTFTVTEGTLAAGDIVTLNYDETGTGTFAAMTIQLDYVVGASI